MSVENEKFLSAKLIILFTAKPEKIPTILVVDDSIWRRDRCEVWPSTRGDGWKRPTSWNWRFGNQRRGDTNAVSASNRKWFLLETWIKFSIVKLLTFETRSNTDLPPVEDSTRVAYPTSQRIGLLAHNVFCAKAFIQKEFEAGAWNFQYRRTNLSIQYRPASDVPNIPSYLSTYHLCVVYSLTAYWSVYTMQAENNDTSSLY